MPELSDPAGNIVPVGQLGLSRNVPTGPDCPGTRWLAQTSMIANYGLQIICVNVPRIANAAHGRIQSSYPFGPIVEKWVTANALICIEQTSSLAP
jgi:hypothetical protein